MATIELYTDGACEPNPGPGGWGCVLKMGDTVRCLSGYEPQTTNNRMELQAVISGLSVLTRACAVALTTDSQYVMNAFTKKWLDGWQKKGWKTANNEPVKNQDLWMLLNELRRKHNIEWHWVKGHSGHIYNEICDQMASEAIARKGGVDLRALPQLRT